MKSIKKLPVENIRWFKNLDKFLITMVILISIFGIMNVFSATHLKTASSPEHIYYVKQSVWLLIGIILMMAISTLDYQILIEVSFKIYVFVLVALVGILLLKNTGFAHFRWFKIGNFAAFQPSELAKLTIVLVLTKYFNDKKGKVGVFHGLMVSFLIVIFPMLLIIKQPNLGTALLFVPVILSFLYLIDVKLKYLLYMFLSAVLASPVAWFFMKTYQKQRILSFLNPNADPLASGYNIIQSQIAIGSGGLFGKGWLKGTQTYLEFIPEHHTDFIFAVLAEEWGFAGCILILLIYLFIIFRGFKIATQARDNYGSLLAVSITMLIAFQVIINILVAIGLLPITGLPLPFFSYGGSSLILNMICIGVLLNINVCSHKWAP